MRTCVAFLAVLMVCGAALADWPQFMGPDRNSATSDSKLNHVWPADGPKVLWQFDLGPGFGAAAISDGKVYILDRAAGKEEILRCIDLAGGKEDWHLAYEETNKEVSYGGSRSTPAVDDKYIVTVGCYGVVRCVDKATHQLVWTHNLLTDFDGKLPVWGVSQSPLIYKGIVIVAPQSEKAGVVAYDQATGKILWQSESIGSWDTSYASPGICKVAGSDQVVMLCQVTGKKRTNIVGMDPASGKILWKFDKWGCGIPIPSPLPCGQDRFFVTGGYEAGSVLFQVEKKDDNFVAAAIFNDKDRADKQDMISGHMHAGVFYNDHIYVNGNSVQNKGSQGLACLDLTGKVLWKTAKAPAFEMGDVIRVDDVLLAMDGSSGTVRMVQATPDGYKQLGEVKVLDQKKGIWACMAYSDGKLIVRDDKVMKCLDLRLDK